MRTKFEIWVPVTGVFMTSRWMFMFDEKPRMCCWMSQASRNKYFSPGIADKKVRKIPHQNGPIMQNRNFNFAGFTLNNLIVNLKIRIFLWIEILTSSKSVSQNLHIHRKDLDLLLVWQPKHQFQGEAHLGTNAYPNFRCPFFVRQSKIRLFCVWIYYLTCN